jgi:methyltransferase family protein
MNSVEVIARDQVGGHSLTTQNGLRPPPKAVKLLLPVWGYSYVRDFLECSLPTLLSAGNIPAVAAALPSEFVVLTSADDASYIREHPTFKELAAICDTKFLSIDHLISEGNYSTTITLAYTEAVREAGAAMIDTCFFFLVSDYIVADGSLGNAFKRMQRGASAVVVGNFQVAREDALPWLQDQLTTAKPDLALPPRRMMGWALNHLHPATLANTVNIPFSHNVHTNRLFWRVDGDTLLGRFYLMHMLCVRPEKTDFIIGASCDYSFIPEMCPTGNVEAITDSDEYLVIELQPRLHEALFLRPGPLKPRALAKSLNEWTTSVHRENVRHSIVFHAADVPDQLDAAKAESNAFLDHVVRHLKDKPVPYRGHPYWRGAMAAFYDSTGRKLNEDEWCYILGLPPSNVWFTQWLIHRARYALMGRPPHVLPWHSLWPDFKAVLGELKPFFADPKLRLLLLSNEPTAFTLSLADSGERVHRMRCIPFLKCPVDRLAPLHERFDLCLLEISELDLRYGDQLIERVIPLMKKGGKIIVSVLNRQIMDKTDDFDQSVAYQSARLACSGVTPTDIQFVPANFVRRLARRGMSRLWLLMDRNPFFSVPLVAVGTGALLGLSFVGNLDALRKPRQSTGRGHTSSVVMRLTVDARHAAEGDNSPAKIGPREKKKLFEILTNVSSAPVYPESDQTREPQYNRCIELKETVGLASLGLMTNQVWYDDPRRLTFLLARYKFVAKMISGCANVGEVGCGDAFGTRVVQQEVPDVTVYDFDPVFIEDIRARQSERWALKSEIHDIVAAPLPRKHDALYTLDVIEHIAPADEATFLENLCSSLSENGLLIVGTPSLESQPYASPPSKAGHINCKSGKELKALLERYFSHVFIFSMNDEVVHTGFAPMAHYLFALCAHPKWESKDDRREGLEASPVFEIREVKETGTFFVQVTNFGYEPRRVGDFATAADAALWIKEQTLAWLRPDRTTSH